MASKEFFSYKPKKTKWKAYCAVDVGCISCGYAYSFKDADNVWTNKNWADHLSYFAHRAPSAILYNKDIAVDFGFSACEKYIAMTEKERAEAKFSYPGLLNHSDNIHPDTLENFGSGKQFEELSDEVMTHRVTLTLLLGKHCKKEIEEKFKVFKRVPEKFVWIFLVPSTWDIEQKARYRNQLFQLYNFEFADEFRSRAYQIKILNTTEALWLSVRDEAKMQLETGLVHLRKKKEKAVIIVHSGGTRTELSLHTRADGRQAVKTATIRNGGVYINQVFEQLLKQSFKPNGGDIMTEIKSNHLASWIEFLLSFEGAKSAFCQGDFEDLEIDIHYSFAEAVLQITGQEIHDLLGETSSAKDSTTLGLSTHGKLFLKGNIAKKVCKSIMSTVVQEIKKMTQMEDIDVSGILLTGGFGETSYVREYFLAEQEKKNMEPVRLHIPDMNPLILPIGAILCVKDMTPKLSYSYGIMTWRKIDKHDRLVVRMKKKWAGSEHTGTIYALLSESQEIEVGRTFLYSPLGIADVYKESVTVVLYAFAENLECSRDFAAYYYPSEDRMDEATKISTMSLKIPTNVSRESCKLSFRVIMNRHSFKVTMILKAQSISEETSVMCTY